MKYRQKDLTNDPYNITMLLGKVSKDKIAGADIGDGIKVYYDSHTKKISHIKFDTLKGWDKKKATNWLNQYRGQPIPNPEAENMPEERHFKSDDIDEMSDDAEYYHARVRNPSEFNQKKGMFTIDFDKDRGIKAVIGFIRGDSTTTTQSILFDKDKWTKSKSAKWMNDHKGRL